MLAPDPKSGIREQQPLVLMALTVLGEAEGEPYQGKLAVAHVIANRMKKHGKSVADTVLAPWQFSCWNAGDPRKLFLVNVIHKAADNVLPGLWEESLQASECALNEPESDPTGGSTHYCTIAIWSCDDSRRKHPRWHSLQEIEAGITQELLRLGHHVFAKTL